MQDGQVWSFADTAIRVPNEQALAQAGNIQLPWQPAQGDLVIHQAEILRGSQRIDVLRGGDPFTVIRREQGLQQRVLDGMLTATMAVPGLQVGDVVHFAFSITRRDPTLKGEMQAAAPLLFEPDRAGFARVRLLWPAAADVKWKAYAKSVTAQTATTGGYRDVTIAMPLPKPAEVPSDAPQRYQAFPIVEASSFADWAAVSRVMAPLYATEGLIAPGSPLAGEVARIAAATSDPVERASLALRLVQDKVSYLLLGMETGNYVPQPPARTWDVRFGDCKAKTLLLLALLRALRIEAEPVLASVKANAMLGERLPSAAAFDHVLVRATVNGESLWLDGTDSGARLADIRDTPYLGQVLPVRAAGAALLPVIPRPDGRPDILTEITLDQRAGIRLPAPFTYRTTVRGGSAGLLKNAAAQGTREQIAEAVDKMAATLLGNNAVTATSAITVDDAAGTATASATGLAYPDWTREDGRLRYGLDRAVGDVDFSPDRARAAWRGLPVRTADPESATLVTRILLPPDSAGFAIDGPQTYADTLAGRRIERTVSRIGNELKVTERVATSGSEIAAADVPTMRARIAAAKTKLPMVLAPADYPDFVTEVQTARAAGRLAPIMERYTQRIAGKPAALSRYTDRAWFADRIMDRKAALADLDRAIALEASVDGYLKRSRLNSAMGREGPALADAEAALKLDAGSDDALVQVAALMARSGRSAEALALVQPRIDEGGKERSTRLQWKADLQAIGGDYAGAIATMDAAIGEKAGNPELLNARCWIKGTGNLALDTALKDCTKAIELADDPTAALDSRAMVYFRLGRFDDAIVDLNAALERDPAQSGSLYLRGIVLRRQGSTAAGDRDLARARALAPQSDRTYRGYGIVP